MIRYHDYVRIHLDLREQSTKTETQMFEEVKKDNWQEKPLVRKDGAGPWMPLPGYYEPFEYPRDRGATVWGNCHKCGLELKQAMAYCCPRNDCPTGLGPITC